VTVSTVGSYGEKGTAGFVGYPYLYGETVTDHLKNIVESILECRHNVLAEYNPDIFISKATPQKYIFILPVGVTSDLKKLGFTQESLREYIYEKTSVPYEKLTPEEIRSVRKKIELSIKGVGMFCNRIPPDRIQVFQEGLKPGGKVPILITPKDLHFIVAGFPAVPGPITRVSYQRAIYKWDAHQTKLIRGATLTKSGR